MAEGSDSLLADVRRAAAAAPQAPALDAFERRWSYAALAARSARLAAVLEDVGAGPRRPLGLLLPPTPTAAMAALAGLALGAPLVPCDPAAGGAALAARLGLVGPGVVVSLDLARLQERLLAALGPGEVEGVLVDRMAELLPFPKNVLAPLLRGGEIAALPQDPRWQALPRALLDAAERWPEPGPGPAPAVLDADGARIPRDALAGAARALAAEAGGGRWLVAHPVDGAWALAALLAPLAAGAEAVLCPRLAPATVAQALARKRPEVAVLSPALAAALAGHADELGRIARVVVPAGVPAGERAALARATGGEVLARPGPEAC